MLHNSLKPLSTILFDLKNTIWSFASIYVFLNRGSKKLQIPLNLYSPFNVIQNIQKSKQQICWNLLYIVYVLGLSELLYIVSGFKIKILK